jgi:hypothetical protein
MVDSGAQGNYISPRTVIEHGFYTRVKPAKYALVLANGTTAGAGPVEVETYPIGMGMGGHWELVGFDVTDIGKHDVILGLPWMKEHNPEIDWASEQLKFTRCSCKKDALTAKGPREICAISKEEPEHQAQGSPTKEIPLAYKDFEQLFEEELGKEALPRHQSWDHQIQLADDAVPVYQPLRQLSEDDLRTLKEYIDANLKKGYIRESASPWGSPVLFAGKKDGGKRLCIDYRKLNDLTKKDRYALPLAEELRDRLRGAKIFTQLDLRGAYNLIRMAPGEEEKTAFRTRYGHYEYTVMPFGLTNAPATFQRLINNVLRPYLDQSCICYLDDILVYSKSEEQHVKDVRDILTALRGAHLLLKPEKCNFHTTKVIFLGFVVTTDGIQMDPEKVATVLAWNPPTTVKEVQSFLGFANYYRRFIKDYSKIAAPLTELTHKDREFAWTDEAQEAMDRLKQVFTTSPVLASFQPEKEIRVETDASDYAIGAVLSQPNEQGR